MNYIILEGVALWLVLFLILFLLVITLISLSCVVLSSNRIDALETQLQNESKKVRQLFRKNLELSFKSGEFDVDEK